MRTYEIGSRWRIATTLEEGVAYLFNGVDLLAVDSAGVARPVATERRVTWRSEHFLSLAKVGPWLICVQAWKAPLAVRIDGSRRDAVEVGGRGGMVLPVGRDVVVIAGPNFIARYRAGNGSFDLERQVMFPIEKCPSDDPTNFYGVTSLGANDHMAWALAGESELLVRFDDELNVTGCGEPFHARDVGDDATLHGAVPVRRVRGGLLAVESLLFNAQSIEGPLLVYRMNEDLSRSSLRLIDVPRSTVEQAFDFVTLGPLTQEGRVVAIGCHVYCVDESARWRHLISVDGFVHGFSNASSCDDVLAIVGAEGPHERPSRV